MKTSETTRPTLSSLPVGKRAEEGTPHNLFTVIGLDDSPSPYLSPSVKALIDQGCVFSGGARHHDIVAPLLPAGAKWIDITVPLDQVFARYAGHPHIIVFASGDPIFFGFANTIRRRLPDAEIRLYPSFNSLQTLAHRLVMPYDDMRTISLTGRPWHGFDRALIERTPKMGILTDREHTPATIASRMLDYGYNDYTMYIGEHLGHPSSSSNASSGMPKKRGESIPPFTDCSPSPVVKIRQLGYSNVSAAASSSVIRRISSFAGCPRCSPMYMV